MLHEKTAMQLSNSQPLRHAMALPSSGVYHAPSARCIAQDDMSRMCSGRPRQSRRANGFSAFSQLPDELQKHALDSDWLEERVDGIAICTLRDSPLSRSATRTYLTISPRTGSIGLRVLTSTKADRQRLLPLHALHDLLGTASRSRLTEHLAFSRF